MLGLKSLVIGQNAHDVANKLANIPCGGKVTSCPD
ncbi:TSCPD domain-containing protein, partial [Romboutsia ilealis]